MSAAAGLASRYPPKFTPTGPNINSGVASPFANYRHVVMEVEGSETNTEYPQTGFYYFVGLSPSDAAAIFAINVQ